MRKILQELRVRKKLPDLGKTAGIDATVLAKYGQPVAHLCVELELDKFQHQLLSQDTGAAVRRNGPLGIKSRIDFGYGSTLW